MGRYYGQHCTEPSGCPALWWDLCWPQSYERGSDLPATVTSKHSREMSPFSPGDHMETPVRDLMTPGVVSDLDLIAFEGA